MSAVVLTPALLRACMLSEPPDIVGKVYALTMAAAKWGITEPLDWAAWLATIGTESGDLHSRAESFNYSVQGLVGTFSAFANHPDLAEKYGRLGPWNKPTRPANELMIAETVYGGKLGNRPSGSGDGFHYKGGGFGQMTFESSYAGLGTAVGKSAYDAATWAQTTDDGAANAAAWQFVVEKKLLPYARKRDFDHVCCAWAGKSDPNSVIGIGERRRRYALCIRSLGVPAGTPLPPPKPAGTETMTADDLNAAELAKDKNS